jgi:HSP20 family protein
MALHREMNRLFDQAFNGFGHPSLFSNSWPNLEITDLEGQVRVTAELPGLEDKDVEIVVENDILSIRGEKRSESEDKEKNFSERYYGRFERRVPLGADVDSEKAKASMRNGVLTVTIPKREPERSRTRKIAITG